MEVLLLHLSSYSPKLLWVMYRHRLVWVSALYCMTLEVLLYTATSQWLFIIPASVLLPELTETGSRSGCCRVVLRCSVIAPSRLGRGYFWLPPCLNPVVILRWIIHASSLIPPSSPLTPPPLFSHLLSPPPPSPPERLPLTPPVFPFYRFVSHHYCVPA